MNLREICKDLVAFKKCKGLRSRDIPNLNIFLNILNPLNLIIFKISLLALLSFLRFFLWFFSQECRVVFISEWNFIYRHSYIVFFNDSLFWEFYFLRRDSFKRNLLKNIINAIDLCMSFRITWDNSPRASRSISINKHVVLGLGVVCPLIERIDISWAQLPPLVGKFVSSPEPVHLLLRANREPVFEQDNA